MSESASRQFLILGVLALTATLSPVSMDILTPSLNRLSAGLGASPRLIELTLYSFLIGYGIAPSLWGPLSDRVGRRPVMLAGMLIYCLVSLTCAMAEDANRLVILRFIQGIGGGAGATVARAVVRDIYGEKGTTQGMARMIALMAIAPFFMPLVGGVLADAFGWASCFLVMGLIGLTSIVAFAALVPETRPAGIDRHLMPLRPLQTLTNRTFAEHAICNMFCIGTLVLFGANFSFVMNNEFQFTSRENGLVLSLFNGSIALGTQVVWWLMGRMDSHRAILVGAAAATLGWLGIALLALLDIAQLALLSLLLVFAAGGCGVIMSLCSGAALTPFSHNSGTASSLYLLLQSAGASLISLVIGLLVPKALLPMALAICACACMALVSKLALSRNSAGRSDALQ